MVPPPVGQPVDEPGTSRGGRSPDPEAVVKMKVELSVGEAVQIARCRLEAHEIDDVDDADAQVGQVLAQQAAAAGSRCRRLRSERGRRVEAHLLVVRDPLPDPDAAGAVDDRLLQEVVERRLLAGHDHVHVVAAAQAVVGDREQAVRVRWEVDADDLGLLVDDVIDEARILVGEAVVVRGAERGS